MNTKADVRQQVRARLQFPPAVAAEKAARICEEIVHGRAWKSARMVAMFAPHVGEPNIELLIPQAHGRRFCFPRMRGDEVDFLHVLDPSSLVVSRWKIREPLFDPANVVPLDSIDLVLVPGVAFTRAGERLGRGGGFYDRILSSPTLRAVKIGVCFAEQIVDSLPTEAHDVGVDVVVSA